MAAQLSTGGLRKFRNWYLQHQAITGMNPPDDLVDNYLSAEMESEMARADASRSLSMQQKYNDEVLKLRKDEINAQSKADTASGIMDIARLGTEVGKNTNWYGLGGKLSTGKSATDIGFDSSKILSENTPNAWEQSMGTNADVYKMNFGKGSEEVAGIGGTPDLASGGGEVGSLAGGGTNWSNIGKGASTAAIGLGLEAVRNPMSEAAGKTNKELGTMSDITNQALQGFNAGRNFGPVGMIAGTILGTEKGGWEAGNPKGGGMFGEEYNKTAGLASLFGVTAGQIETKNDSSAVKVAKAITTGGMSKIAGKIKKKLKKLF